MVSRNYSGRGGSSIFGVGGDSRSSSIPLNGLSGTGYGAGGGGGMASAYVTGGDGSPGVCVILEFYGEE